MMEARLLNGREGVIVKEKNDGNVTEEKLAFTNLPKEKLLFLQKEFPTNYPFLTRRPSFLKTVFRSSHRSCSVKKDAFKNSRKFTGKHLCKSLFFNKVIKKETLVQVFSCEFCGISKKRTPLGISFWMRNVIKKKKIYICILKRLSLSSYSNLYVRLYPIVSFNFLVRYKR